MIPPTAKIADACVYFVFIIIGFVALLGMPKGLTFCWISGVVIFAAQGALCNLLPSYVASKYGRWDYTAGYQVIGTIFEIGAGIGVMMTGFFAGKNNNTGNPAERQTFWHTE